MTLNISDEEKHEYVESYTYAMLKAGVLLGSAIGESSQWEDFKIFYCQYASNVPLEERRKSGFRVY